MAHPSASAHRSKDWESFQYDIQKKTVNLPRGRSDMLPLVSPSHGGRLSLLGPALPLHMYLWSHYFCSLLLSMWEPRRRLLICWICSWRWNVVPDLGRRHCIMLCTRWVTVQPDAIFWVKIQAPLKYKHRISNKAVPLKGKKGFQLRY